MCHALLQDPRFFRLLQRADEALASETHACGCACGGVLHRANYPRKPRACPSEVRAEFEVRFSFCCNRCTSGIWGSARSGYILQKGSAVVRRTSIAFVAGMLLAMPSSASEYTSTKPLLLLAIDAPGGKARGVLIGPVARKIASTTGSSSPVLANVSTIKSFKQEGCRRLNLRLSQANVPTKSGKKTILAMDYSINLCRDGNPPMEGDGLDVERSELKH